MAHELLDVGQGALVLPTECSYHERPPEHRKAYAYLASEAL